MPMDKARLAALVVSGLVHALLLNWIVLPGNPWGHQATRSPAASVLRVVLIAAPAVTEDVTSAASARVGQTAGPPQSWTPVLDQGQGGDSGFATNYYPAKVLSRMPQPTTSLASFLETPEQTTVRGTMSVRLWINRTGGLDRVSVVRSELPQSLEQTVVAAFAQMHFTPGEIKGAAVMTWVDVVVDYGAPSLTPTQAGGAGPGVVFGAPP